MGQPVGIVSRRPLGSSMVRYELDRSLTGNGHESYTVAPMAGERPPDLLAQRLFASGQVSAVHIFSNVVTISLQQGLDSSQEDLSPIMRDLYIHYLPGVRPTPV